MSASKRCRRVCHACVALLCGLAAMSAFGQTASREQEQLRRLRGQVQQLQQEQSAQQEATRRAATEKASEATLLQATTTQRDAARTELRRERAAASAAALGTAAAHKDRELERTAGAARLAQLQSELQASIRAAEQLRVGNAGLQRALAERDASLAELSARHALQAQGLQTSIANNRALHDIGMDLLQRYANKTVADVLGDNEPFLQTRRVALENLMQGYTDQLDLHAVKAVPVQGRARAP